jgi:hypothetical protein
MKRYWPFDDFQPVGLTDLLLTGVITSMVVWPPFFGTTQCWFCIKEISPPVHWLFVSSMIAMLIVTGAVLGLLCSFIVILGGRYRRRWVSRWGPFLAAGILVGLESWAMPFLFGDSVLWRGAGTRALSGVLISMPGAWLAVRIALQLSGVHPYRSLTLDPSAE